MIISLLNLKEKIVLEKYYIFLSFSFFLLIGFRYCGYDFFSYENIFDNIKNGNDVFGVEFGFIALSNISNTYRHLLVFMALLTVISHLAFIYKTSDNPLFSLFLLSGTLLLPTFMGQMRQGVALGFVAISFCYYSNKNFKLALVSFILAFLFHFSSLLSLLFLFIPKQIKGFKYYFLMVILSIFAFQFLQPVVFKIINLFPNLVYFDKLIGYSDNDDVKLGFNTAIIIRIFILSLGYHYRNLIKNVYFPHMLNIYLFSIILYLTLGPIIPQLGGRGALYFSYFDLIIIPAIISAAVGYKKTIILFAFVLLTFLRIFQFFHDDFNRDVYVPYFMYL